MKLLLTLAVRIKTLGYIADGVFLGIDTVGEGKRVEAASFYIYRIVAET